MKKIKLEDLHTLFFIIVIVCLALHHDNFLVIDFFVDKDGQFEGRNLKSFKSECFYHQLISWTSLSLDTQSNEENS